MAYIKIDSLSFTFSGQKTKVLNNVILNVEKGAIYGFLGPNGAGKTTTIRSILGLLPIKQGHIEIFGKPLANHRSEILSRLGAFIETPSLYEHLSGYENLLVTGKLKGISKNRILEVLKEVNLGNSSLLKVKNYSLGMKQRLGLALALLSHPELLILDEPTNGLDPNGINEIRELLLSMNRAYGTTIFVSSHLLTEIERMATHLGIIHNGHIVFEGKIDELVRNSREMNTVQIQTNNNIKAKVLLQEHYSVADTNSGMLEIKMGESEQTDAVTELLVNNGLRVFQLRLVDNNLEKIYLSLTQ